MAMNDIQNASPFRMGTADLEGLRKSWFWLVVLGIALMVLGMAAMGSSFITTLATLQVFGILMILGAVCQFVSGVWGRQWRGFFLHLLCGILYLITGVFMLEHPLQAAMGITLLIAASLLAGGLFRIVLSVAERFDGWVWVLINGIVSVLLGIGIWRQWPLSGFWVIGLFVGIEMFFSGLSWLMLGLTVKSVPKSMQPA